MWRWTWTAYPRKRKGLYVQKGGGGDKNPYFRMFQNFLKFQKISKNITFLKTFENIDFLVSIIFEIR